MYSTTNYGYGYFYHPSPTVVVIWLILVIAQIAGLWKIFEKAGKPGWAAIIPIYNAIVLLEIVGKPWWWLLLLLIPCANIVFGIVGWIWISNLMSKSFGQGVAFTLGLMFLPYIFYPVVGFGDYTYLGPGGIPYTFGATDYEKPFDINP